MQKPMVFNRHLNRKWGEKENDIMIDKLINVKCKVDIKCPESFTFFKTQLKKPQTSISQNLREFEIRKNNQILVEKIMNIFSNTEQKETKRKKTLIKLKQNLFSNSRKWDLFKVAQDNQNFLKRLNEKQSFYNSQKWEQDYEKSKTYKKNICVFPVLNFENKNTIYSREKNYNLTQKIKLSEENEKIENNQQIGLEKEKKNLYSKRALIGDLLSCLISFYLENKKFTIEVVPAGAKKYFITFENIEEISKIQKVYQKYEEIIADLDYDKENDKLLINTSRIINLNYTTFYIENQNENQTENEEKFPDVYSEIQNYKVDTEAQKLAYVKKLSNISEKKSFQELENERVKKESESVIKNLRKQETSLKENQSPEERDNIDNLENNTNNNNNITVNNMNNMSSSRRKIKISETHSKDSKFRNENIADSFEMEEKKENDSDHQADHIRTMSNKAEEDDDYVSYSKLKESRKTLSRPSNLSNYRENMKNFKAEGEIGEENVNSDPVQPESSKEFIKVEKNYIDQPQHDLSKHSKVSKENSFVEDIEMS